LFTRHITNDEIGQYWQKPQKCQVLSCDRSHQVLNDLVIINAKLHLQYDSKATLTNFFWHKCTQN